MLCAMMLLGMVSMAMRVSVQARNQRADQDQAINEGREALDTIERMVSRAVELQEWNASTNTPEIRHAWGEGGDSFRVSVGAANVNLGAPGPNLTVNADDIVSHDGTRWSRRLSAVSGTWDPLHPASTINPTQTATAVVGDTIRVSGTTPGPYPDLPGGPTAPAVGLPPNRWHVGDILVCTAPNTWGLASWRADSNFPNISDATGAIGDVLAVNVARPPVLPLGFQWTPTFSRDLGSGPLHLARGDYIVRGPFGWRKLANQWAIKNFKSPTTGRDDNVSGIQFFADVDPPTPAGFFAADCSPAFPPAQQRKILEWVWIWWDGSIDADQNNQPYDRRGPLKVAIFRAYPSGNPGNEHDLWTRATPAAHPLFSLISSPTQFRRAYHTTASNFGTMQMKVQTYASPVDRSFSQVTWAKRVAVTGGVFLDRTGELANVPGNPWDDVAPGSRFVAGAPSRFRSVPSYTFCRSIYAANAGAAADDQNRPFTFNPNVPNNPNGMRRRTVGWQTRFAAGNVKNDHVVQPR